MCACFVWTSTGNKICAFETKMDDFFISVGLTYPVFQAIEEEEVRTAFLQDAEKKGFTNIVEEYGQFNEQYHVFWLHYALMVDGWGRIFDAYENYLEVKATLAKPRVAKASFERYQTIPVSDLVWQNIEGGQRGLVREGVTEECSICHEKLVYSEDNPVVRLACNNGHYFHQSCIDRWFEYRSTCPSCSEELPRLHRIVLGQIREIRDQLRTSQDLIRQLDDIRTQAHGVERDQLMAVIQRSLGILIRRVGTSLGFDNLIRRVRLYATRLYRTLPDQGRAQLRRFLVQLTRATTPFYNRRGDRRLPPAQRSLYDQVMDQYGFEIRTWRTDTYHYMAHRIDDMLVELRYLERDDPPAAEDLYTMLLQEIRMFRSMDDRFRDP